MHALRRLLRHGQRQAFALGISVMLVGSLPGSGFAARAAPTYCHDLTYPTTGSLTCFSTEAEQITDILQRTGVRVPTRAEHARGMRTVVGSLKGSGALHPSPIASHTGYYYVTLWENINYGGSGILLYYAYNNLHSIGWGDRTSSSYQWYDLSGHCYEVFVNINYDTSAGNFAACADIPDYRNVNGYNFNDVISSIHEWP